MLPRYVQSRLYLSALLLSACSSSASSDGARAADAGGGGGQEGGAGAVSAGSLGHSGAGGAAAESVAGAAAEGGSSTSGVQIERSSIAADDSPDISDADYAVFMEHLAKFGLDLGQKTTGSNAFGAKNLVYSPLSAAYALAMTYGGARGETAAEMKAVLGDSFSGTTYHSAANRLARELASRVVTPTSTDTRKIELTVADALFLERTLQVEPSFLDLLAREYDSGVQRVDFRNAFEAARVTINDWVAEQTHDKILDLLPMEAVNNRTPAVLVNALYFYGSWRVPFNRDLTRPTDFHTLAGATIKVDTMHETELSGGYASAAEYNLADISYVGSELSMTIVLPSEGKFESVRSAVSQAWLKQAIGTLQPKLISIALPKFKMTVGSFSLKDGLEALGIKQAFRDDADFSGIARALSIGDVVQKCFIAIDEDGTEAAAATAAVLKPNSAQVEQPIPFIVDRPFLFFVHDANGAILFSGHVVDPTAE